jgi:dethiobiotin synthetase
MGREYFLSGIDTDCGKTYITGLLAKKILQTNKKIITTKLIQTGCNGISEDIIDHRRLMKIELFNEDHSGLTCPIVLSFPASPHLAAEIDNKIVSIEQIRISFDQINSNYEIVLSEGAGGLMVPVTEDYLTIDYVNAYNLPLILVSSSKLGSINHTLLSLEACKQRKIKLFAFIYNQFPDHDKTIAKNSFGFFKSYLKEKFPDTHIIHSRFLESEQPLNIQF